LSCITLKTVLHFVCYCTAGRQAIGVEVILGALTVGTGKSSKDLHILDAGT